MKIEIKEVEKERQDGFYKIKVIGYKKYEIALWSKKSQSWSLCGDESIYYDDGLESICENKLIIDEKTEQYKPEFEPFELSLTIESKEELQELWHRLNISIKDINDIIVNNDFDKLARKDLIYYFWKKLNEIIEERNIKP